MGNFEKLSVLVIVVIIVMILVVALYTWTDNPESAPGTNVAELNQVGGSSAGERPSALSAIVPVVPPPVGRPGTAAPAGPAGENREPVSLVDLLKDPAPASVSGPVVQSPPAPPATPAATAPRIHKVARGETVGGIAREYFPGRAQQGTQAILASNPGLVPERMREGSQLTIPDLPGVPVGPAPVGDRPRDPAPTLTIQKGGNYVTKRGDTLPDIAKRAYGKTERWPDIYIENFDALGGETGPLDAGIRLRIPR